MKSRFWISILIFSLLFVAIQPEIISAAPLVANEEILISEGAAGVKVVPIGDSITQGSRAWKSWRYPLWKKLIDGGYSINYIGSMKTNSGGNPVFPDYQEHTFDTDNEGHWGWTINQVLSNIDRWLASYTPDIALIHLGTNDNKLKQNNIYNVNEIALLIDKLRADNPRIVILLAQIIPSSGEPLNIRIRDFNSRLATLSDQKNTEQSPLILVDQYTGYNGVTDNHDGLHPNLSGEEKMAQKWFDALKPVLDTIVIPPPSFIVPDEYSTIQQAIDAADSDSEIVVRPKTYLENINFKGKSLKIRSERGAATTIISGNGSGSVVTFARGENAALSGFTIINGRGTKAAAGAPTYGGGIYCKDSSPSIINCLIKGNQAVNGAGIYCFNSSPSIVNCTIVNNAASGKGGAIMAEISSAPVIVNSILWGNFKDVYPDASSRVDIAYSDVQQTAGVFPGEGNINASPVFAANYQLGKSSPCIDKGSDDMMNYPDLPFEDMNQEARPQDGNLDGTTRRDMGADEYGINPTPMIFTDKFYYASGQSMKVSAQVAAGKIIYNADLYIRLIFPDGAVLYYPGLTAEKTAFKKSWPTANWKVNNLFSYTFTEANPCGEYVLEIYLTKMGEDEVIGPIGSASINYVPE